MENKKRKKRTQNQKKRKKRTQNQRKRDQKKKKESIKRKSQKVKKTRKSTKIIKMILEVIMYLFMVSIIVISLIFTISGDKNRDILGYRFYTVLTNSMVPDKKNPQKNSFYAQDVILVKTESYENLKKGDVVSYSIGEGTAILTHRLIGKTDHVGDKKGQYMLTKGDANESEDPPINAEKLLGKVVFVVPKVGLVITFIRENIWLCILFAISLFGSIYVIKNYYI